MKKLIVWILCFALLSSLLVSCQKDGKVPADTTAIAEDVWQIKQGQLVIVRSEDAPSSVVQELRNLKKTLKDVLGWNVEIKSDFKATTDAEDGTVELVIGDTTRPISQVSKAQLPSKGYVICNENRSIAIQGTNDAMLVYAIRLFSRQFVQTADVCLQIPNDLLLKNKDSDVIVLVEDSATDYSLSYSSTCDGFPNMDSINNGLDYEVTLVLELEKVLKELTGATFTVSLGNAEDPESREILIGDVGRTELEAAKKDWSASQYGVVAVGNKLVVSGWNDVTLGKAVDAFRELVEQGTVKQDGKCTVYFMCDHLAALTAEEWNTDFPQYDGGKLSGTNDASYGQMLYYYTETNVDEYRAYCQKLEGAGYTKRNSNETANNVFATYVKDDSKIHVYYVDHEKAVRLITGSISKTGLAENDVTNDPKVTDFSVIQMNLTYASSSSGGMGYVITLEDGRFVIVDGGRAVDADAQRLYNILQKYNKRSDGIVIAGWFLTHEHSDHYGLFKKFVTNYSSFVKIQNFYISIPSESYRFNSLNPSSFMQDQFPELSAVAKGIPVTLLHTGQKFLIGNAEFEILYTTEDLYPQPFDLFNDASVVFRVRANGNSVLFTGDIADRASNVLCDMYGSYLKSDIVQVSHHGWNGATLAFYQNVSPKVAMWPNSQSEYTACMKSNAVFGEINRMLVNMILGSKNVYIADTYCYQFVFPFGGTPIKFTP